MEAVQSEIVGVAHYGYRYESMIYVVKGPRLFQVDRNYLLELPIGTEVYGSKMRSLKNLLPMPRSEVREVLERLKELVEGLM